MLSKKSRTKYRLLYFLFLFISSFAYNQQYFSKQLTTKDGLPDNNIYSVLKDRDGNLWVGTANGLAVKGAKLTKIYKKKDGLPNNACWQIIQDQLGQIWIGTYGGGLALFQNEKFRTFDTKNGIASNNIRKLFLYKEDLYIGTSNGISKINVRTKKIENFIIKNKTTPLNNEYKDVMVLGIAEINGEIIFNTHSHGIYFINGKNADVLNKQLYTTFCLFKDKKFLLISKNGFVEKGNAIYKVNAKEFISTKKPKFRTLGNCNSIFWDIKKIKGDSILGAAHGVEYNTGGLYLIGENIKKLNSIYNIESNNIWDLFYDEKENILYVGTLGEGLYIINLKKNILKKNIENVIDYKANEFFTSAILEKEKLTIDTQNLHKIFTKKELFELVKNKTNHSSIETRRLSDGSNGDFPFNGFILKSIKLEDNSVFISTNYGIIELELRANIINKKVFILSSQAYKFIDKKSILYAFPYSVLIYIPDIENPLRQRKYEILNRKYYPRDIINIFFTSNNKYILTREGKLYLLEGKDLSRLRFKQIQQTDEFEFSTNLSNSRVALSNKEGDVYVLNDADEKNISFQKIISHSNIYGNTLLSMLTYKDLLVLATEKGINLYNLKTKKNIVLDKEMGIEYNTISSASIFKNQLKLATDEGTYDVDLSQWTSPSSYSQPKLSISKFLINEKAINPTNNQLKSNENRVSIEFDSNSTLYPDKVYYRYRLKGLKENSWSKLSHENICSFAYLPSGNYNLIIEAKDYSTGETNSFNLISFTIATPLWKNPYFIGFSIIILMILFYFYVKNKIKKVRKREQEIASFEKRIVETKMEALQSQMNPHFIFNSLNVIQNHIIDNDVENSLSYVSNFSRLMRKTLEHSSKPFISINEEIEFIRLYIDTQNIRFNHAVDFKYAISKEIDREKKIIPPMLIQPLIENCFIHAFSEEIKDPKITLKIKQSEIALEISITDNGRGINKEFKNTQSKALSLLKERIQLLNKENKLIIDNLEKGTEARLVLI